MVERAILQDGQTPQGPSYWLSIEIQPQRVVLYRRWARHLGLSDADLAARIFTEGTIGLALDQITGVELGLTADEDARHVERLLDDLNDYLTDQEPGKEAPDAPNHH